MASVTDNGVHGYTSGQSQGASSGGTVVHGVAEQAKRAGGMARDAARGKLDEARGKLMEQANTRKSSLVEGIGEFINVLEQASQQTQSELPRRFIQQATGYLRTTSDALERGSPEELIAQARDQMRARPLASIAGLFAAGFLAGRLLKL